MQEEIQGLWSRFIFPGSLEILDLPDWSIIQGHLDRPVCGCMAGLGVKCANCCWWPLVMSAEFHQAGYLFIVFPSNFLPVELSLLQSRLVIH